MNICAQYDRYSRVSSGGSCIVRKTELVPIVAAPFVQNTLVATVPGAFGVEQSV